MSSRPIYWLAAIALVILSGCSSHWASTENEFEGGCWEATDTLRLDFESDDTSKVYALSFPIVLSDDYPYHNIYLRAIMESPSGDKSVIPSEFVLADRTGAWLSEPDGDLIPFQLTVADGLRFNQQGKYVVRLYHFMRDPRICGIQSAGIALDVVE
jgi:gliding motility-associated lipoprotein GldH